MSESDMEFLDDMEAWVTGSLVFKKEHRDRLFALARRGAAVRTQTFTEGHCEQRKAPGGCKLHNLHCGYPDCDRRPLPPPPKGADE